MSFNAADDPSHKIVYDFPEWYPAAFCREELVTVHIDSEHRSETVDAEKINTCPEGNMHVSFEPAGFGQHEITVITPKAVDVLSDSYTRDVLSLPTVELWLEYVIDGSGRAFEKNRVVFSVDVV